jgi:hypothetical protein
MHTTDGCEHYFRLADGNVADCLLPRGHVPETHEFTGSDGFAISWIDDAPFGGVADVAAAVSSADR